MRAFLVCLLCIFLSGCGTIAFTPTEYPLRDGLILAFDVSGTVSVSNAQPSSAPFIVYSDMMGSKLSSDLKTITEVMVQQVRKELQKNGRSIAGTSSKTIALKVNSLLSVYQNVPFWWKSKINFQATLGNGDVIQMEVPHASGNLGQDLNGCIAEGVMTLLKNERVKAYIAA